MLDLGLLLSDSQFLPVYLSYITKPGIFLDQLMVCEGPVELSRHWFTLEFFYPLIFNAGLKFILDILGSSFLYHIVLLLSIIFFLYSAFCFAGVILSH